MLRSITLTMTMVFSLVMITMFMAESKNYSLPYKIYYSNLTTDAREEVECLAENIYFESAMEPKEGKLAVAFVTMNRLKSGKFADSICGVVKQKIQNVCQFSWWCEDKPKAMSVNKVLTNSDNKLYNAIRDIALFVYMNHEKVDDPSNGAMFYHADYVNPRWPNMIRTNIIGRHIFYNRKFYEKGELV